MKYNAKVQVLRSNNGREYQSSGLQKYLEGHDIIHQFEDGIKAVGKCT